MGQPSIGGGGIIVSTVERGEVVIVGDSDRPSSPAPTARRTSSGTPSERASRSSEDSHPFDSGRLALAISATPDEDVAGVSGWTRPEEVIR